MNLPQSMPSETISRPQPLGGIRRDSDGTWRAQVWAPSCGQVTMVVTGLPDQPMSAMGDDWYECAGLCFEPGTRYLFRLPDGRELPDPASHHQPEGVHGPSAVADLRAFPWSDAQWRGIALTRYVIYELHLGTFTAEGTCDAAIERLDQLVELGVTAVELMPVAQCPGRRNWGYDGVFPFAVQHSLGGPVALQRLVDACHARGLAVVLDVVYNHLGPEGNCLGIYMPITSDRHRIPWGEAINVDGPGSDGVRAYFTANARHWFREFHIDALRLDAVHAIIDTTARPFLACLTDEIKDLARELGRPLHLIAESDLNASRVIRPTAEHGYGMDSQWNDDFHHALHALLTGERHAYYADYGTVDHLRRAFAAAYVYDGRWSANRRMTWGDSAADLPSERFTVCAQNHDQIGNRYGGERLSRLTDFEGLKFAAACILLSPYLPLLFMGEEWGERRPFHFFADHGDPALRQAVQRGRDEEFPELNRGVAAPDPFAAATRDACRLDWSAAALEPGRTLRAFYRACLQLRQRLPSLHPGPRSRISVQAPQAEIIAVERNDGDCRSLLLLNPTPQAVGGIVLPPGRWTTALASQAVCWNGPGGEGAQVAGTIGMSPRSALLLQPAGTTR